MTAQVRAAVDIGGTFTDVQMMDVDSGRTWDFKEPTTPEDPSIGLIAGLAGAADRAGIDLARIGMILHGSTIATNAVLQRRLPRGALLTTRGFEDVLAIGRHMRRDVYALRAEPRTVLIPEARRYGVAERVRADGSVETALSPGDVEAAAAAMRADGVETVAVMFLHAFRNPVHEDMAAAILSDHGLTVALSHQTSPEIREFERASTTVLNALLKPVISDYLTRVEARLSDAGIGARLLLVQSNGGVATPGEAARLPVRLLLSGPSGGAMAIAALSRRHRMPNLVGIDMGGTSSDVSLVQDGRIEETAEGEIDGLPVRLPMVEIRTIGAGGGSIARAGAAGLRVGPDSAGSTPGPACYGRGGAEPTVTDANLAIGLIDPAAFLGGAMVLDAAAARAAVAGVASALDLSVEPAASGIVQVANAAMAGAVRLSLFEKGANPADYALAAFGGAAGLHACEIAEELDMNRILFPASASTLSARGILGSDIRHDLVRAHMAIADESALPVLEPMVTALRDEAAALFDRDGIAETARHVEIMADLRYRGQAYEITTRWQDAAGAGLSPGALRALIAEFHRLHKVRFSYNAPDDPVEIVAVRATARGVLGRTGMPEAEATRKPARQTQRAVWMGAGPVGGEAATRSPADRGWIRVPVLDRHAVGPDTVAGPALIEEAYSVIRLNRGWALRALPGNDLLAERVTA
ncbi:MAG: hydantoinase/oxoprolinase family protein [Pseudomonadota bacterium]